MCQPGLGPTTFHQDNPYQDWHDSSGGVITAWIALEKVTKEMGGLEFAVGSHRVSRKGEILNEPFINSDNYRIEFENFEQTTNSSHQIVAPTFAIGDVSFHHGDLWHGSGVNNSKHTRMSFSIHLMEGVQNSIQIFLPISVDFAKATLMIWTMLFFLSFEKIKWKNLDASIWILV